MPVSRLRSGGVVRSWAVPAFWIYYQRHPAELVILCAPVRTGGCLGLVAQYHGAATPPEIAFELEYDTRGLDYVDEVQRNFDDSCRAWKSEVTAKGVSETRIHALS